MAPDDRVAEQIKRTEQRRHCEGDESMRRFREWYHMDDSPEKDRLAEDWQEWHNKMRTKWFGGKKTPLSYDSNVRGTFVRKKLNAAGAIDCNRCKHKLRCLIDGSVPLEDDNVRCNTK